MQVSNITSQGVCCPSVEQRAAAGPAQSNQDNAEFLKSQNLDNSLDAAPDVREGEVHRATFLASSVKYPPEELIDRISQLLARHWNHPSD